MRLRVALFAIASSVLPSVSAFGVAGHEIVATIAQIHLHPSVLPVLCDLLNIEPSDHSEATLRRQCHLAPVAVWADQNRPRMPWSAPMHYVGAVDDHPRGNCQYPGNDGWLGTKNINVLDAIQNVTGILARWSGADVHAKNGRTLLSPLAPRRTPSLRVEGQKAAFAPRPAGPREEEAFRFLVHFVGDLHQPLHLTGRDRGGNLAKVCFDNRETNLHSVWDTPLLTRLIRTVPPQYSQPLPDRGDLPIPSAQIELALRRAIYDPFIRRVMWEGIESKWIHDIDGWLSCPTTPAPESQSESIFAVVSRAITNPLTLPRALVNFVSSAASAPEGVEIIPDGPVICPYAWSAPIHKLNCDYVWPPVFGFNGTDDEVSHQEDGVAACRRFPILDTQAYLGPLDENLVLEKLVAQGGLRLAGLLNWLFATEHA
ncbi:hypothetical protein MD484_g7457, partial [Candolleomyces efflorescens]